MIRIAICEDKKDAVASLLLHLEKYREETGEEFVRTVYENGLAFIEGYKAEYDVVFMDIEMPVMNGLEASKLLRERDPYVALVFITDLRQFALNGYEVEALDYLVKPVTYDAFRRMMARVRKNLERKAGASLVLQTAQGAVKVDVADVLYVEVSRHYVNYHTMNGVVSFWGSLSEEEKRLPAHVFARCNSGILVNLGWVQGVKGCDVTVGSETLPISRNKKGDFMQRLLEYMSEKNV